MKKKRDWEKRFADSINKEIKAYKKEGLSENNRWCICGIKDTLYLLGSAINEKEHSWASGFQKFLKEIGIEEI